MGWLKDTLVGGISGFITGGPAGAALGAAGGYMSSKASDRAKDAADYGQQISAEERQRAIDAAAKREQEYLAAAERAGAFMGRREDIATDLYGRERDFASRNERIAVDAAQRARDFAERNERAAYDMGRLMQQQARAKHAAARKAAGATMGAYGDVAGQYGEARDRISDLYQPFMESERTANQQRLIEMGLAPGDPNRSYREANPAYREYMEASRVQQGEDIDSINQMAANSGNLYGGARGEALIDRYQRGNFQRAGIEQNYYQDYMDRLSGMADPRTTSRMAGVEEGFARDLGDMRMNAQREANAYNVNYIPTGYEGGEMMRYLQTGTEGSQYMPYLQTGREGAQYIDYLNNPMVADDIRLEGLPTGTEGTPMAMSGANYRGIGAYNQNLAGADLMGGLNEAYRSYQMGKLGNQGNSPAVTGTFNPAATNAYPPSAQPGFQAPAWAMAPIPRVGG